MNIIPMITYNKILVCLDLTPEDESIIKNAAEIAKAAGTKEVIFINILMDFNLPDTLKKEFPDLLPTALKERKDELQQSVDQYFDCSGVSSKIIIRQGNETKEILSASIEEGTDLIVLGRKKESDSVLSTRITRRAACNLLIIPAGTHLTFDKILVPVDFSNYSELAVKTAKTLSQGKEREVYLQNVYNVPSSYRYSGKTYEEFAAIMEENSEKDLAGLIRIATGDDKSFIPVHTLDDGHNVTKLVINEAKKRKANLIVMGAKGRTAASALFIGSKAERMIQINKEIPLLVVREKGANAGIIESLQDL